MTQEEFDAFSELSDHHLTWKPRKVGRGSVLSRLCRCDRCGGNIVVTGGGVRDGKKQGKYYGCINRLQKPRTGKRCDLPFIPQARLEDVVLRQLSEFLHDERKFQRAIARASSEVRTSIAALERLEAEDRELSEQFDGIDGRMARLVEAIEYGTLTKEEAKERRQAIDRDKARITRRLDEIGRRKALLQRDSETVRQVEISRSKFATIVAHWQRMDALDKEEKQQLLHALLPRTAGCGIIVGVVDEHTGNDPNDPEPLGSIWVQITGMLQLADESPALLQQAVTGDSG